MRLAVVGSSNITDHQLFMVETIVKGWIYQYRPSLIISGGAKGVDRTAEVAANMMGVPTSIYLPLNARWEPEGYKDRNLKIATECTHLLCIRSLQSTTYGSGWTADRAEEMGKTVWRVTI